MAELRVDIASEFTGKKAFDKAAKATSSLDKAVGKLGRQLVSVFAVTKIVAFGKASVKAFLDDEAAATRLGKAVENLGLAFAQPQIDNYISKLEASSSVADDLLRPAFQSLLTTTGSLTKSQELLSLAIEASRGSGVELSTVAQDLASAFVGNTKGLRKYNLGLTQAELKTMSFTDVQEKFNQQFSGASQAFLSTYAGQLNILAVAAGNAQEVIGKGLVDALVLAGGKDGDIQNVSDAMAGLAEYTADSIRGIGVLVSKINALDQALTGGALGKLLKFNSTLGFTGLLSRLGNEAQERPKAGRRFMGGQQANLYSSEEAAQKKLARQQAELTKKQIAAQKKLTDEQKKQAALKKAGSIFDLEQVQLIAALKGKLSDEDRKRVELQFAIITGNTKEAQLLTYELAKALGLGEKIAKDLASLPDAKNPFASWEAYLDMLMTKAQKVAMVTPAFGTTGSLGNPNFETGTTAQIVAELDKSTAYVLQLAKETDALIASIAASSAANPAAVTAMKGISPSSSKHVIENFGGYGSSSVAAGSVIVQIDGKAVASALQDSSLSGIGSSVNRTGR
jgi:hypothetical protein